MVEVLEKNDTAFFEFAKKLTASFKTREKYLFVELSEEKSFIFDKDINTWLIEGLNLKICDSEKYKLTKSQRSAQYEMYKSEEDIYFLKERSGDPAIKIKLYGPFKVENEKVEYTK